MIFTFIYVFKKLTLRKILVTKRQKRLLDIDF